MLSGWVLRSGPSTPFRPLPDTRLETSDLFRIPNILLFKGAYRDRMPYHWQYS